MYKLLAIDLDGTLLNSYGTISNKNKQAIKKSKRKRYRSCNSIWKTYNIC